MVTDEEIKKWDEFNSRMDVKKYRAKAQLARNRHEQSEVAYWENRLMDSARSLGLIK